MKDLVYNNVETFFVIAIKDKNSDKRLFIADFEKISDILSHKCKIPMTFNVYNARRYFNIEDAKSDLYNIKYYYRHLLKQNWKIIPVVKQNKDNSIV